MKCLFTSLHKLVEINADNALIYLPPANKVCEGYVFTGVCHRAGVCPIACWDADPPVQCMLGYGQQVGGTHVTGMHSG